jgi:hypothetical protein
MKMTPDSHLLFSLANAKMSWIDAIGEWIDNAFDADAKSVHIAFTDRGLRIQDDGRGTSDLLSMIRLGAHKPHGTTKLGRYGIGGKDAALWAGGMKSTLSIYSAHKGAAQFMGLTWEEVAESDWDVPDPKPVRAELGYATCINIDPLCQRRPSKHQWQRIKEDLAYTFSAGLRRGRQIKLTQGATTDVIAPWQLPAFDGATVDTVITVGKRTARVVCGVVRDEVNDKAGFTYLHEWRVIEAASDHGCGRYSSSRVCGMVELDASWPLTRNKNGITHDAEELYAAVEEAARPVLERADQAGDDLRSNALKGKASGFLNQLLQSATPVKGVRVRTGVASGTVTPTHKGSPHKRAAVEQPGNRFPSRTGTEGSEWSIEYRTLSKPDVVGEVRQTSVVLNLACPVIAHLHASGDWRASAIQACNMIAFENSVGTRPLFKGLPAGVDGRGLYYEALGHIFSQPLQVNMRPVVTPIETKSA